MKRFFYFLLFVFSISFSFSQAPFWTENFGTGCNQLQLGNGVNASGNGPWVVTYMPGYFPSTGSDEYYVSATEAGMGAGNCGNGCLASGPTDRTLHISNSSSSS